MFNKLIKMTNIILYNCFKADYDLKKDLFSKVFSFSPCPKLFYGLLSGSFSMAIFIFRKGFLNVKIPKPVIVLPTLHNNCKCLFLPLELESKVGK